MRQSSKRSGKVMRLSGVLGLVVVLGLPCTGSAARVQNAREIMENCKLVAEALGDPPGCQRQCVAAARVCQSAGAESQACAEQQAAFDEACPDGDEASAGLKR